MTVKTYSYSKDKNTKVSAHFSVKEFASISDNGKVWSDKVLIDTMLIAMLEALFEKLKCKYIIVNSGYRTAEHDKAVGGSGKGKHCEGKAADIVCYDKSGKVINAKIVCCVAQDLGFGGIANISSNFRAVHLDVRTGSKYKGDERFGYNTVTQDFYGYYKISKADVEKYTGTPIKYFDKFTGSTSSLVEALKAIGENSAFSYRKKIAAANKISGYAGTATQNTKMLNLLKQGKLIKP